VPTGKTTLPQQWNKYLTQSSGPIHLRAGQHYFISALQEQHGGRDDTLSVAWEGPGMERVIIDGKFLVPYSNHETNGIIREYWNDYFAGAVEPLTSGGARDSVIALAEPIITVLGSGDFPKPLPLQVGSTVARDDNFRWVETEGVVEFESLDQGTLRLELAGGKKHVRVQVLN